MHFVSRTFFLRYAASSVISVQRLRQVAGFDAAEQSRPWGDDQVSSVNVCRMPKFSYDDFAVL